MQNKRMWCGAERPPPSPVTFEEVGQIKKTFDDLSFQDVRMLESLKFL